MWTGRGLEAMFLVHRIKMGAGARKSRAFALSHRVNMNRVEPFRKPIDVYSQQHTIFRATKGCGANSLSFGVLDIGARVVLRVKLAVWIERNKITANAITFSFLPIFLASFIFHRNRDRICWLEFVFTACP